MATYLLPCVTVLLHGQKHMAGYLLQNTKAVVVNICN